MCILREEEGADPVKGGHFYVSTMCARGHFYVSTRIGSDATTVRRRGGLEVVSALYRQEEKLSLSRAVNQSAVCVKEILILSIA